MCPRLQTTVSAQMPWQSLSSRVTIFSVASDEVKSLTEDGFRTVHIFAESVERRRDPNMM